MAKAQLIGGPRDGQVLRYTVVVLIPLGPGLDVFQSRGQTRQFPDEDMERWRTHGVYMTGTGGWKDRTREGHVRLYWQGWNKLGNR